MIIVSACLVGINSQYDGKNHYNEEIFNLVKEGKAIPVCPEQLGGLTTPRAPSEIRIVNGERRVFNNLGEDVTKEFTKGALEVIDLVKKMNIKKAILRKRSPSCGKGQIYDGSFTRTLVDGNGILADLLLSLGVEIENL